MEIRHRATEHGEALDALFTALTLGPSAPHDLLIKWVRALFLQRSSPRDVLDAAIEVCLCDVLILIINVHILLGPVDASKV